MKENTQFNQNDLKVCLIEDDPVAVKLVNDLLLKSVNRHFIVKSAKNLSEGIEFIDNINPDIILLDLNLPDSKGLESFKTLQNSTGNIPVIILTGNEDVSLSIDAVKRGAQDYIYKNRLDSDRLIQSILYSIERKRIQVELESINNDLISKEKSLRDFINKSLDGIIITDIEGKLIFINPVAENIIGHREPELKKEMFGTFLRDREKSRIDILRSGMEPAAAEYRVMDIKWENKPACMIWLHDISKQEKTLNALFAARQEINRYKVAKEELLNLAKRDPLTGLPNRIMFHEELRKTMKRIMRHRQSMGALVIDLDNFKLVNDTLGHRTGDRLLEMAAERMKESIREIDTLARIGGDEFFLILENIESLEDAAMVADRIVKILTKPFDIEGKQVHIGSSIGISIFPDDANEPETLFRKADIAMYQAKADGKNRYCFFTKDMDRQVHEKAALSNQIHDALDNNEFRLLYQPQVDIKSGRIIGVEALLRWHNPERGIVSPEIFIPILEETNLIVPVGEWVIREACAQSRLWHEKGLSGIRMAVNCSPKQFADTGIKERILGIMEKTGMAPEFLELEITEGLFMEETANLYKTLHELHSAGITIVMDDFGTGYSSLSYLKRFPVDGLKIDRMFVSGIIKDPGDMALVSAITGMAIGLNLVRIVAEGVEEENQIPILRQLGCDSYQGFLFSRPVPPDEFEALFFNNLEKTKSGFQEFSGNKEKKQIRILLVEDNPVNQRLTTLQLKQEGFTVDLAQNGQGAIEAFHNYPFYNLILMDIHMPVMDGYLASRHIRQLEHLKRDSGKEQVKRGFKRTPIIALSAYSDDPDPYKGKEKEIDDFLMKPVKKKALLSLIEKWAAV